MGATCAMCMDGSFSQSDVAGKHVGSADLGADMLSIHAPSLVVRELLFTVSCGAPRRRQHSCWSKRSPYVSSCRVLYSFHHNIRPRRSLIHATDSVYHLRRSPNN